MDETMQEVEPEAGAKQRTPAEQLDGVAIGILIGFGADHSPLVAFPDNRKESAIKARSTAALSSEDIGRDVALLFENGDPERPLVIGRIQKPSGTSETNGASKVETELDGERLVFSAEREIVLRCGKASITLTRAGKVIIRGAYLLSRSSGVNRIKGGSIQLN